MADKLAAPCGVYCGSCGLLNSACQGCRASQGRAFWGECEVARCCLARDLEHCGQCPEYPCGALYRRAYDPERGDGGLRLLTLEQWRAFGVGKWLKTRKTPA